MMNQIQAITKTCLVWGICVFALVWSEATSASIVLYLTDQQMSVRADRIVRARVTRKISRWEPKKRRIYTYITLSVLDPIKGASGSQQIQIRQIGGTANGIGMYIPGAARFNLGEEVLVFLEKIKKSSFHHVMSMSYGKFQVVTNPKTKLRSLVRQLKGISLARRGPKGRLQFKHGHQFRLKTPLLLDAYVKRLRSYLLRSKAPSSVRPVKPKARTVTPKVRPGSHTAPLQSLPKPKK